MARTERIRTDYRQLRRSAFVALQQTLSGHGRGRTLAVLFTALILINVIFAVLETDAVYAARFGRIFDAFAALAIIAFSVEYVLRLWSAPEDPEYQDHPVRGRARYAVTPLAIIDFLSIVPFILFFFLADPELIALMRFARIFWILKLGHYSRALNTMGTVLRAKKEDIFITFFILFIVLVLASGAMYFVEHDAQPEKFSSVLAAMWWGVETLSTVGYGDIIPVTPMGRLLGSIVAMSGIGLFALPAGIFASGFIQEIRKGSESKTCPHCGKDITKPPETDRISAAESFGKED